MVHIYFLLHCSEHKIIKLLNFSNVVGHGGFSNHFIKKTFRKFHVLYSQFVIIHEKYLKKKFWENNHLTLRRVLLKSRVQRASYV
jgi:predicted choloylglycine hydrolase